MGQSNKMSFGTKFMLVFSILCIAVGFYKCTRNAFGTSSENPEDSSKPLACDVIQSWNGEQDILNSLQGTWVMENEDYYGKRKFQFSGNSGKCWKMEKGTDEWKDEGNISFDYSKKYENTSERNQGAEYEVAYKSEVGWFTFKIDCVSGIYMPSDRYTYGISLLKIEQ